LSLPFILPRYFLGGDRPSQTTNNTLSLYQLVKKKIKSGISLLLKFLKLIKKNNKLPPILHIIFLLTM